MTFTTGDDNFATARFIVSATPGQGNFTTIQAAINAASSGADIFIMPGTYTENLTLKAGVNICANVCDQGDNSNHGADNVLIIGKATATFTGICIFSGVTFQTNGDFVLSVTGTNNTNISCYQCNFSATNSNLFQMTVNDSGNPVIRLTDCIGLFLSSTSLCTINTPQLSTLVLESCQFSSASSTVSTVSGSANLFVRNSALGVGVAFANTAIGRFYNSTLGSNGSGFSFAGTSGMDQVINCVIATGTSFGISISSGATVEVSQCVIDSSNAAAISVIGTLNYSLLTFIGSSSVISGAGTIIQRSDGLPLSVSNGGTSRSTLTSHALQVGNGTSAPTQLGPTSTAGQVLQSAGASSDPVFSTATYPSTAGTSGNILTSNGTNFVSSAPSYLPATCNFFAYLNTSVNNVTGDGTVYQIAFDTKAFDVGSNFTTGASANFTAPATGTYMFGSGVFYFNLAGQLMQTYIKDNTASIAISLGQQQYLATVTTYPANASGLIACTAGDVVYVTANASGGSKNVGISGGSAISSLVTFFWGYRLT